jgi:hypothetical protein
MLAPGHVDELAAVALHQLLMEPMRPDDQPDQLRRTGVLDEHERFGVRPNLGDGHRPLAIAVSGPATRPCHGFDSAPDGAEHGTRSGRRRATWCSRPAKTHEQGCIHRREPGAHVSKINAMLDWGTALAGVPLREMRSHRWPVHHDSEPGGRVSHTPPSQDHPVEE